MKWISLGCLLFVLPLQAHAEKKVTPPPGPAEMRSAGKTLRDYLSDGYEVKATVEMAGLGFVLQKGSSVALCFVKTTKTGGRQDSMADVAFATNACMETIR